MAGGAVAGAGSQRALAPATSPDAEGDPGSRGCASGLGPGFGLRPPRECGVKFRLCDPLACRGFRPSPECRVGAKLDRAPDPRTARVLARSYLHGSCRRPHPVCSANHPLPRRGRGVRARCFVFQWNIIGDSFSRVREKVAGGASRMRVARLARDPAREDARGPNVIYRRALKNARSNSADSLSRMPP